MKFLLLVFVLSGLAQACPEYGVEINGVSVDGYTVRARGNAVLVIAKDEKDFRGYEFTFDESRGRSGEWCVLQWEGTESKEACGNTTARITDARGRLVASVGLNESGTGLEGTPEKGAVLLLSAVLQNQYVLPVLRFVYSHKTTPKNYTESLIEKLEAKLQAQGVTEEEAFRMRLNHRMYVDLFHKFNGGILGTAVVEKSQIPFGPVPKGEEKGTDSADLRGRNWKTSADSSGCHTSVTEVK